nr:rhomboid family intramembrane serine protease [Campylobacter sp. RM6914]
MFLHGSLSHLIMNMVVLFQFGSILERNLGHFRFLLIYILGGIATSFLTLIYVYYMLYFNAQVVTVVGASGAICVLLGVLSFLTDKETRKGLVIALLLMSFAPLFFGVNIAWYAHLLGFAIGYIYAKMSFK